MKTVTLTAKPGAKKENHRYCVRSGWSCWNRGLFSCLYVLGKYYYTDMSLKILSCGPRSWSRLKISLRQLDVNFFFKTTFHLSSEYRNDPSDS